jgi:hypothetical protein
LLARLRRSRLGLGRGVLAVFTATWLGLALQPCTADASPDDEAVTQSPMDHHAGGCGGEPAQPQPEPRHDCPHCPSGGLHAGDCGTALDCKAVGVPAMVSKASDPPRADLGAWIDLPALPPGAYLQPQVPGAAVMADRSPRAPPRSVQQRFCSYLK